MAAKNTKNFLEKRPAKPLKILLFVLAILISAAIIFFLIYSVQYRRAENKRFEEATSRCGGEPVVVFSDQDLWGNVTRDIRSSNNRDSYEYAMKSRSQNEYYCSIPEAKKAYPDAFVSSLNYSEQEQNALKKLFIDKLNASKTKAYQPNVPGGGLATRVIEIGSDSYSFTAKNEGHPDTELTCRFTKEPVESSKGKQVGTNYQGSAIYFSDQTHTQRWSTTFPNTKCELVIWKESSGSATPQANIDNGTSTMASMREMPVSELLSFELR